MWPYAAPDDAILDALRLSRAMTLKLALMDLPAGGGKAVVIGDPARGKSEALLVALGRAIDRLGGRFVMSEDVGIGPADIGVVARETRAVLRRRTDAAEATAYGVYLGMREAVRWRLGRDELYDVRVAIQGAGRIGAALARYLTGAGARVLIADVAHDRAERLAHEVGAALVDASVIASVPTDVFAPCALGPVLDDESIPRLRCAIVAGSANVQLASDRHADALAARGVWFVPDLILNAGGVLSAALEAASTESAPDRAQVHAACERIPLVLAEIFDRARCEGATPHALAIARAEARVAERSGR